MEAEAAAVVVADNVGDFLNVADSGHVVVSISVEMSMKIRFKTRPGL